MRRAQGFQPTKQFNHKPKVRRSATRIIRLQADQGLELTSWRQLMNTSQKVDRDRVNWRGFIVYSRLMFDPRPRLRRQ